MVGLGVLVVDATAQALPGDGRSHRDAVLEPLVDLRIDIGAKGEALVAGVDGNTFLVVPAGADAIAGVIDTAAHGELVALAGGDAEELVLPIDVHQVGGEITGSIGRGVGLGVGSRKSLATVGPTGIVHVLVAELAAVHGKTCSVIVIGGSALVAELLYIAAVEGILLHPDPLFGRSEVDLALHLLPAPCAVELDAGLAALAVLGGDEHYAVGTTRTVDGRRGGVLEDFNRLDVVGVDGVDVVGSHTIDHIERVGVGMDGSSTTYTDLCVLARLARGRTDLDTCHLSLKCGSDIRDGSVTELLGIHLGHRTSEGALLGGTVTDGYDLLEHLCVFSKLDLEIAAAAHGNLLCGIADE